MVKHRQTDMVEQTWSKTLSNRRGVVDMAKYKHDVGKTWSNIDKQTWSSRKIQPKRRDREVRVLLRRQKPLLNSQAEGCGRR